MSSSDARKQGWMIVFHPGTTTSLYFEGKEDSLKIAVGNVELPAIFAMDIDHGSPTWVEANWLRRSTPGLKKIVVPAMSVAAIVEMKGEDAKEFGFHPDAAVASPG